MIHLTCAFCHKQLSIVRDYTFTCSAECHDKWIAKLCEEYGEAKRITSLETGKTHLVPTKVMLEQGIKGSDLHKYPTV